MLHEGWAVICQIGLWGWVVSAVGLIVRAFPAREALNGQAALRWGGALAAFYAIWIAGMVMA